MVTSSDLSFWKFVWVCIACVHTILDSFCAPAKIIPDKASVHTQERLWQRDFRDTAKLRRAHL